MGDDFIGKRSFVRVSVFLKGDAMISAFSRWSVNLYTLNWDVCDFWQPVEARI
jgi:hypothetical protein